MNLWRRFSGQRSCKILYVMTPWSKELNDFTNSNLQVYPSLHLAFAICFFALANDCCKEFASQNIEHGTAKTEQNSFALEGMT